MRALCRRQTRNTSRLITSTVPNLHFWKIKKGLIYVIGYDVCVFSPYNGLAGHE